ERLVQLIAALGDAPTGADALIDAPADVAQPLAQRPVLHALDDPTKARARLLRVVHEAAPRIRQRERINALLALATEQAQRGSRHISHTDGPLPPASGISRVTSKPWRL